MIYLLCFVASASFAYLANKTTKRRNLYIFSFCSIAIMVLLAGLRDYSIGIDTMGYLTKDRYWAGAISASSLFDYLKFYFPLGYGDPLFALLVGSIAQFTGSFRLFLFVCHTIIITFFYIGTFRHRKMVNPAFILLIFYLFFYNQSFNIMRQYMAMSIIFAFLIDIQNKKYWRYIVAVIVAMLFHSTAVLGFAPLLLYIFINYKNDKLKITTKLSSSQKEIIISCILLLGVLLFSPLIKLMIKIGVLNERFMFYITSNTITPAIIVSGIVVIGLLGVFCFRKQIKQKYEQSNFYIMCSIVYLILLQLTFFVAYGRRIAQYFAFADLITWGLIANAPKDKKTKLFLNIGLILVALLYWLYVYFLRNSSKTIPYVLGV